MEFLYYKVHRDNTALFFIPPSEVEINSTVNVIMIHGSSSSVELSSVILV